MNCLMELDNPRYGLSQKEKLAYLGFRFAQISDGSVCPVTHIFEPGVYVREILIPAASLFVGRPHLFGHRCELVSGRIVLITEDSKTHMEAPAEMHTAPGYMMCLYAKTEVIGRTYHPNPDERRDVEVMEAEIFAPVAQLLEIGRRVHEKINAIEAIEGVQQ